jgi:branched-chain amino acid transport system permease protein
LFLTKTLGLCFLPLVLVVVLLAGMALTSVWNWSIERLAYRPLRGSFRLAPLISAIGMSTFLSNFVQVAQGPRNKPIAPMFAEIVNFHLGEHTISLQIRQMVIVAVTVLLLLVFWYLVQRTNLGRAQRACEQDRKMAALIGVDVDRTISITFIIGAALAAVAGSMYVLQYGVVNFADGFLPGVKAFTAAVLGGIGSLPGAVLGGLMIGLIETLWQMIPTQGVPEYKDVAAFSILAITLIFMPSGLLGRPEIEKV